MVREIIPNLFQIPVPLPDNPLRELNAYLIRGTDRSLLIDTGFRLPPCRAAIENGLREAGVDRSRMDILCTHIHTDHTGQSLDLITPGRTIYIGAGDYPMTIGAYDAYFWRITDQRFSAEGFPPEEARVLLETNPARTPCDRHWSLLLTCRNGPTWAPGGRTHSMSPDFVGTLWLTGCSPLTS